MLFQWIDLQRGLDTEQGRVGRVSSMYSLNVSRVNVGLVIALRTAVILTSVYSVRSSWKF